MDAGELARKEHVAHAHAVRLVRPLRPFRELPYTDPQGRMMHGFLQINRDPISVRDADVALFSRMSQVMQDLRPRVMPLMELHPDAMPRIPSLYAIAELLGTKKMLAWEPLWSALNKGDWRGAGRELWNCKYDEYFEVSQDVRNKVFDIIQAVIEGRQPTLDGVFS